MNLKVNLSATRLQLRNKTYTDAKQLMPKNDRRKKLPKLKTYAGKQNDEMKTLTSTNKKLTHILNTVDRQPTLCVQIAMITREAEKSAT